MKVSEIMANLEAKHPGEKEYLQAVQEVLESIEEVYNENPKYESAKIVERLVEPDRIFTFRVTWVDDNGQTPFDVATLSYKNENASFIQDFINSKEYKDHFKKYKLHQAVINNNYQYVYERANSSNVNDFDYFGRSAIYYAITLGNTKIVELLYKKGAKIDSIDEYNQSALLIAIYSEKLETIELLLKHKADVNEIFYNRSYLYRAIVRNSYEMTRLLIMFGADVNYIDTRHRTIYSYAMEYANDDIIELSNKDWINQIKNLINFMHEVQHHASLHKP